MKHLSLRTSGKWILAGEHSVLRGCPALVFPLSSRPLDLNYQPNSSGLLDLHLSGEHGEELQLLFWGVFEKACELKKIKRSNFSGHLELMSRIPVGAGLGASAALCVAVALWLSQLGFVKSEECAEFARTLENLFHGESSGVDIAVAMKQQPLLFLRGEGPTPLKVNWAPRLYVSYSGQRGVTSECVSIVKKIFETNKTRAESLDQRMREAVQGCVSALQMTESEGFDLLAASIEKASTCFLEWGLVEGAPQQHQTWLKQMGAVATKPTGSGRGGYVLSLWRDEPPSDISSKLISCF